MLRRKVKLTRKRLANLMRWEGTKTTVEDIIGDQGVAFMKTNKNT